MARLSHALAFLASSVASAHVYPRQTTFSNTTTVSRTTTGDGSGHTPPPCCWILAGEQAVGLNKWYSSTAEHVIATVITTYIRENNGSAIPANSTTIYVQNQTEYPTLGTYGPYPTQPWISVPDVPGTLLPDGFNAVDYARTILGNATAMTFPGTDLVIQQPTPYDLWGKLAIYTMTPSVTGDVPASLTAWPDSSCGAWNAYETPVLIPSDKDLSFLYTAANRVFEKGMASLNATYILPKTSQLDSLRVRVPLPTGLRDWLGTQEHVAAQYPYIGNCYTWNGEGQPTVHVPVNALTVTSSHIIDVKAEPTKEPEGSRPHIEEPGTTLVSPTRSVHTEKTQISLDVPTSVPTGNTVTLVDPPKTAHVETTQTSLARPPAPTDDKISTIVVVPSPHSEKTQTTLDRPTLIPGTVHSESVHIEKTETSLATAHVEKPDTSLGRPGTITWDTSIHITLSMPRTEEKQTSLIVPGATESQRPKAVVQQTASNLDVPGDSPANPKQPGTAVQVERPGQNTERPRPSETNGEPDNDNGNDHSSPEENSGQSGSDKPQGNQGQQASQVQNTARPTVGGAGGLISAIQSVASQQGGASYNPQNGQKDDSNRPAGGAITAAPGDKPSVTGFVIGTQTASPGGAPITQGGSTFSALPSGSGIQVVADGQTKTIANVAAPGVTAAQVKDSEIGYIVGKNTLTAGGAAVTRDGSTFSALPSGGGIVVVSGSQTITVPATLPSGSASVQAGGSDGEYIFQDTTLTAGGQALTSAGATFSALPSGGGVLVVSNGHTSTIPVSGSADLISIQSGDSENEYVLGGKTLTASGSALTSAGTTYSALPSGSGLAIIVGGTTSTASIGEKIASNTAESDSGLPTPVLLPSRPEQLVTIGGSTYTAHITEGSLLVLGSQTLTPGVTAVINGETLLLTGSDLVLATGTSTSTRGLGDAIMSGVGGGSTREDSTPSETAESSAAEPTSGAGQRSLSDMRVLVGGFVLLVFALVLV